MYNIASDDNKTRRMDLEIKSLIVFIAYKLIVNISILPFQLLA